MDKAMITAGENKAILLMSQRMEKAKENDNRIKIKAKNENTQKMKRHHLTQSIQL